MGLLLKAAQSAKNGSTATPSLRRSMFNGAAYQTGKVGVMGGAALAGFSWMKNTVAGNITAGVAAIAITASLLSKRESGIGSWIKTAAKAAAVAALGYGAYRLYSSFNDNASIEAPANPEGYGLVDGAFKSSSSAVKKNNPPEVTTSLLADAKPSAPELPKLNAVDETIDSSAEAFKAAAVTATAIPTATPENAQLADNLTESLTGKTSAEIGANLDTLKTASKGRFGGNIPLLGTGVALTFGGVMTYQFITQRKYIEAKYAESVEAGAPIMSKSAYDAYVDLSTQNQALLSSDLGLSAVDPIGITLPISAAAEMSVYSAYKDWIDTHAPNLDTAMIENLSMSLITPDSARTDIVDEMKSSLSGQTKVTDYNPAFEGIIKAQAQLHDAVSVVRNKPNGGYSLSGYSGMSTNDLADMKQSLIENNAPAVEITRLETALQETQAIDTAHEARNAAYTEFFAKDGSTALALSIIKPSAKIDITQRLFKSEIGEDPSDAEINATASKLAGSHPEIAAYLEQSQQTFPSWGPADNVLRDNPAALDAYILERLENPVSQPKISPEAPVVESDELIAKAATTTESPVTQAGVDIIENAKAIAEKTPTAAEFSEAVNVPAEDVKVATADATDVLERARIAASRNTLALNA